MCSYLFSDLTGTRLESNHPIGVFSGNNFMVGGYEPPLVNPVHLVEQLPPIDDWGYTFYLVPLPGIEDGYTYKIVTSSGNCSVSIETSDGAEVASYLLQDPGSFTTLTETGGNLLAIRSTEPVMVAQFAGGTLEGRPIDVNKINKIQTRLLLLIWPLDL